MRRSVSFACIGAMCIALIASGAAGRAAGMMGMESGDLRISTDSTDYNIGTGEFSMPHHVTASRPDTHIEGDRAHGNGKDKLVILEGHVVVKHSGGSGGGSGSGGDINVFGGSANQGEPSTLTTDKLTIELGPKRYTAEGNVHFVQGNRKATAARAILDDNSHELHMSGNVRLDDNGQSLEAATLDYNTVTETVHANNNVRIIVPVATPGPSANPTGSAKPGPSAKPHRRR